MEKKKNIPASSKKIKNKASRNSSDENEQSVGSSNAFEATENPQKDSERELSDEELDDLIDGDHQK